MDKKRFNEINDKINSSMRMKLNQIRTFLDMRKASVMVGAGFSKNAVMSEDIRMKDWGELCEDFYTSLYDSKPSDRDFRLKSALRLAQQIESTMGRTALDEIIKNSLPNDSISPGYLHKLLVSLNWRDIFTTNYDSLLENAAVKACRHYNVVTSKDSLIYQPHPRIVKLHGSFPDNRPFIITEEDYRTYPERFPEFVNTIRQALIETQFCLIGFSGDDPNFLSWIGWFRDIMGNQMLPIYMIYVGSRPHDSEMKLLSYRKVDPIITGDISQDPVEAMDFILSYIGNKFKEDVKWSGNLNYSLFGKGKLNEWINEMRQIRESYPGWIILPADRIEKDFDDCCSEFPFMEKGFSELNDSEKLNFIYEYTWRLQTSFMPSWLNKWYVNAIQEILSRYDTIEAKDKNKVDYLSVSLLQILRITDDDDFNDKLDLFKKRISPNNTALHRRIKYEEALWALSHCEFACLDQTLASWDITPDDYIGAIWKSKILVEIGKADEATRILEESLGNARRKLMSNSKSEYQLSAVTIISDCLSFIPNSNTLHKDLDEKFRFVKYFDLCKKEVKFEEKIGVTRTHGFNIGTHSTSWSSGRRGYIQKYVGAGRYYLLTEAYGAPIGTKLMTYNTEINQLAISLIADVNLEAALLYLIESNDRKAFDTTISRQVILDVSEEEAIRLYDSWIKVLDPYMEFGEKLIWYEREFNIVLPILVRLCVWLDYERIQKIIKFIWSFYKLWNKDCVELLTTCYNSLPQDKSVELWWKALELPITLDLRGYDIVRPNVNIEKWNGNEAIVNIINEGLLSDSYNIRKAAVNRFCDIHTVLPQKYQDEIDHTIFTNFDNLLNTNLISILGVSLNQDNNRIWKNKFMTYLKERVIKFVDSDFKILGSSEVINDFDGFIIEFIDCYKHLTEKEINEIFKKILDFLNDNYKVLYDTNDSYSLFGGLRGLLNPMMSHINMLITRFGRSFISYDLRNELLEKLRSLSDLYPLIRAIVCLSFFDKSGDTNDSAKEIRQFIKSCLEKDVISSDHDRMRDAFWAAAETQLQQKVSFSIQDIIKSSIDHIRYHLDSETEYILLLLPIWITQGVIMKQNLKILFEILSLLPKRIVDAKDIAAELKSDMLYYGGLLVGQISKTEFSEVDKMKCVESWQLFANSHNCPIDIRNGFFRNLK